MAILRKLNNRATATNTSGFGTNASDYGGRYINKSGTPNVVKKGVGFWESISWYHTLLRIPGWKFFSIILLFYASINFVFACIYLLIGTEHLAGIIATTWADKFGEAYFFSTQTFTTVGYGRISPTGVTASTVAAIEALLGLLTFAIATGLFYGRFSKPKAYMRFSENALIAPYKDGIALMMRVATYKNNLLLDVEAKLNAGIIWEDNGQMSNKFYQLELEYAQVNSLALSWTIVHPINENSPFYTFGPEDFKNIKGELLLYLKAFDDMFSNTVVARTSYTFDEIVVGAKFVPMYHRNNNSQSTAIHIDKINKYDKKAVVFPSQQAGEQQERINTQG